MGRWSAAAESVGGYGDREGWAEEKKESRVLPDTLSLQNIE